MAATTSIEWTDATWDPVTGCDEVSPGCDHCYARRTAERFTGPPAFPRGFAVTLHSDRLNQPLRWRTPRRVFVNSMGGLFHEQVLAALHAGLPGVLAELPPFAPGQEEP